MISFLYSDFDKTTYLLFQWIYVKLEVWVTGELDSFWEEL